MRKNQPPNSEPETCRKPAAFEHAWQGIDSKHSFEVQKSRTHPRPRHRYHGICREIAPHIHL